MMRVPERSIQRHVFAVMVLLLILGLPFWLDCCQMVIGLAFDGYSSLSSWIAEPEVDELDVDEPSPPISTACPTIGIKKVILRAANADRCKVIVDPEGKQIEINGQPVGGARGYRPIDCTRRGTPPSRRGVEFVYIQFGDLLVISTKGEIRHIHHLFVLTNLELSIPPGVEVVLEKRKLTGKGQANVLPPSL